MAFKWYYHDKTRNETLAAIKACYATDYRPMLLFVGNPGCAICAAAWKKLNTPAMDKYLKEEGIVGLKIEDSTAHYQKLASAVRSYRNPDGSRPDDKLPFLVFLQPAMRSDPSGTKVSFSLRRSGGDCRTFYCGSNAGYLKSVTAANVMKWLNNVMEGGSKHHDAQTAPETSTLPMEAQDDQPEGARYQVPCTVSVSFYLNVTAASAGEAKDVASRYAERCRQIFRDVVELGSHDASVMTTLEGARKL